MLSLSFLTVSLNASSSYYSLKILRWWWFHHHRQHHSSPPSLLENDTTFRGNRRSSRSRSSTRSSRFPSEPFVFGVVVIHLINTTLLCSITMENNFGGKKSALFSTRLFVCLFIYVIHSDRNETFSRDTIRITYRKWWEATRKRKLRKRTRRNRRRKRARNLRSGNRTSL